MASTHPNHGNYLKTAMGSQLSCYNGTVRLYWPMHNTPEMRNPRRHPYWPNVTKEDKRAFASGLLRQIAEFSISRMPTHSFSDVKRETLLEKAHDPIALELAEQYAQEADRLKDQIMELQNLLTIRDAVIAQREAELEELRHMTTPATAVLSVKASPKNPHEAALQFQERYGNHPVCLTSRALRAAKDCEFAEPELIEQSLEWLADVYHPSKVGRISANLTQSARDRLGMSYAARQYSGTMGMYEEEYRIEHNGKKLWLESHLGVGKGRDPRRNLRIAFTFDERDQSVIVGYIGLHQTNTKT
jgi:hypothetical protein